MASTDPRPTPDTGGFDADQAWRLDPRVQVRPERFGALLYHYGTRRLSFLKSTSLLSVVHALPDAPSARHALVSAGVAPSAYEAHERALAALAASGMIIRAVDAAEPEGDRR